MSIQRPPAHSLYIVNISPFTVRSITHPPPPPPPPGKNKYLKRKTGFLHSSVPWFILQLRFETKQKVQCFEQVRIFRRDLLSLLKNSFYSTILAQKNIISISVWELQIDEKRPLRRGVPCYSNPVLFKNNLINRLNRICRHTGCVNSAVYRQTEHPSQQDSIKSERTVWKRQILDKNLYSLLLGDMFWPYGYYY